MYKYSAEIIRIVDGDTIDCIIDVGFNIFIKQRIRLLDIDVCETYRPKSDKEKEIGLKAKQYLKDTILNQHVLIETKQKRGKYGRLLAKIFTIENSLDIIQELKNRGFEKSNYR